MKITRVVILALALLALAIAQNIPFSTFTPNPVFSAITAPATSVLLRNVGQTMHVLEVEFPTAVGNVSPIQVRLEFSYDGTTFFPLSRDITSAVLLGGRVYFINQSYGVFPAIRVRSLLATPGALPMTVRYSGHALPVVPGLQQLVDRFAF